MNDLKGIIYLSKANLPFDAKSLKELLLHAATTNHHLGISGHLHYEYGIFFQYIEGTGEVVQILMDKIRQDVRHDVLIQIKIDELTDRKFSAMQLSYVAENKIKEINLHSLIINHLQYLKKISDKSLEKSIPVDFSQTQSTILGMMDKLSKYPSSDLFYSIDQED